MKLKATTQIRKDLTEHSRFVFEVAVVFARVLGKNNKIEITN
jgi:hypothetical protein